MSSASDLWAEVVDTYDAGGLRQLTNIGNRSATSINTTKGEKAAQAVINLFPAYAQAPYDPTSVLHVEAAKQGVIAILWRWGGSSTTIEQVKYDTVFADDGLVGKLRKTGARARPAPASNSGVARSEETMDGQRVYGWSDPGALPSIFPSRVPAE